MPQDWRIQGIGRDYRRTGFDQPAGPAAPETPAPDFIAGRRVPGTLGEVHIAVTFRMKGTTDQPRQLNYALGR